MPTPRCHAAAVHVPELDILVVGGLEEPDKKSRTAELLEMNNGDGGTWTAIAPMIELRGHPSAVYSNGSVLVSSWNTVEQLSFHEGQLGQWSVVHTLPSPGWNIDSMCSFNGRIVLAGELTTLNYHA